METRTAIESHNLSFSYGTLPVLENVSFSVPEGSYTALIGANGAGKSTLLKLLLGELTPTSGALSLLGQPIRSFRDWPRIGYVPQGTQAGYADFPASVSEVVSARPVQEDRSVPLRKRLPSKGDRPRALARRHGRL